MDGFQLLSGVMEKVMIPKRKELQQIFEEKGFTPRNLYNSEKTGLF